ncbi:MAG: VPLPA-CTERM sorting domain-containing protein [Gammaproteobacteria bacterium]|nr:MAG: VPLPA-CTERM sorting domain-containing protein [Gammaproteobacteria bacterium]
MRRLAIVVLLGIGPSSGLVAMSASAATVTLQTVYTEVGGDTSAYCGNYTIGCNVYDSDSYHDVETLPAPNQATGASSSSVTNATAFATATSSWSGTISPQALDILVTGSGAVAGSASNPGTFWANHTSVSSRSNLYHHGISVYTDAPVKFVLDYAVQITPGSSVWGGGELLPDFALAADDPGLVPLCYFNFVGGNCSSLHVEGTLPYGSTTFLLRPAFSGNVAAAPDSSGGYDGGVTYSLRLQVAPVPIPAAAWLFSGALAALGWLRRRQNQRCRSI